MVERSLSNALATSSKTGSEPFPSKSKAKIVAGRGKGDEPDDGGFDGGAVVGASSLAIVPTTAAVVPIVYPVPGVSVRATV